MTSEDKIVTKITQRHDLKAVGGGKGGGGGGGGEGCPALLVYCFTLCSN